MDSRLEERLVDVDIAQTTDEALVEEHGLDLAWAAPQALLKPRGCKFTLERLTAKPLLEQAEIVAINVNDATELALVGESQIESVGELDRQALEAKWRLYSWDRAQPAGHPQVDDDGGIVVELDNQILGAATDTTHGASFDPRQDIFDAGTGQNAGIIGDPQRADPL